MTFIVKNTSLPLTLTLRSCQSYVFISTGETGSPESINTYNTNTSQCMYEAYIPVLSTPEIGYIVSGNIHTIYIQS